MTSTGKTLKHFEHRASNRCFGCGPANASGLQLDFLIDDDLSVVCLAQIADHFEGHPGYLHGGAIATILDEAMSKAVRARSVTAMTRELKVEYLRPVPSKTPIQIEGRVHNHEGRKYFAEAAIFDEQQKKLATAAGMFIELIPKSS